ncbi:MAG: hypothetical protein LRY39_00305 [Alphaproteobacteria bacterium]|nr:hypothetical protein [Alphaproteobacteria bacterium]
MHGFFSYDNPFKIRKTKRDEIMANIRVPKGKVVGDLKDLFAKAGVTDYEQAYLQADIAKVYHDLTDEQIQVFVSEGCTVYQKDVQFQTCKPA